jgi:2,3-diaminopropionate biosynthesis protein SbnB
MLYLNTADLLATGIDWNDLTGVIYSGIYSLSKKDYSQPIKLYLRYNDLQNRIIAMPAYIGGNTDCSGIKWIASYPRNIEKNIQRAHSMTVLNDADTGKPFSVINSALVSGLRTAAVTGVMINEYLLSRGDKKINVGINGFGPIGKLHLQMMLAKFRTHINSVIVYDLNPEKEAEIPCGDRGIIQFGKSWEDAYTNADVFMTCTVSKERYINKKPKTGSLQLNVSLRDYVPDYRRFVDHVVVDDWEEVCRENTDIERMHLEQGLQQEQSYTLAEVIQEKLIQSWDANSVIMFNPMGMAIFDISIAKYYYDRAMHKQVGVKLDD